MKNEHQWHEITTPPHFRFNCFKCGKACDTMRDTDARADLNGPAFKAYYCGACAQGANSVIRYVTEDK